MYLVIHDNEIQYSGGSLVEAKASVKELVEAEYGSDSIDLIEGHEMQFEVVMKDIDINIL